MTGPFEKQVNRALRRVVFWRCLCVVTHIFALPFSIAAAFARTLANVCDHIVQFFSEWRNAIFSFELEHARRYEALTGVRLGKAIGQPYRYTDLHDTDDTRFPITEETS